MEKYLIDDPADVDGDCIDDITELSDPLGMNPVNPAAALPISDGAVAIPDQETFEALAFHQEHLSSLEFAVSQHGDRSYRQFLVKFILVDIHTDRPGVYFINNKMHLAHRDFTKVVLNLEDHRYKFVSGSVVYDPQLVGPNGAQGVHYFWLHNWRSHGEHFSLSEHAHTLLAANLAQITDNLLLYLPNSVLPEVRVNLPLYRESRFNLVFDEDVIPGADFLPLNPGEGYGLLRGPGTGRSPEPPRRGDL